ncbi:MAG: helix-turn-helix domain-containing protein [Phycisphaerales bacterium]|nr:MAG: helix-turn-helix domain-containing protein [Phycisphaerales bacterium]
MQATGKLTETISRQHFARVETVFREHFDLGLETLDAGGRPVANMCSDDCNPTFCSVVRASRAAAKRCLLDRMRSLSMAFETGQPYASLCHAGIVLVCIPAMQRNIPLGGLFFGKCLWESLKPDIEADIIRRLRGLRIPAEELTRTAAMLPVVAPRKIHEASEFLFILLYQAAGLDPRTINWRRQKTRQQSEIAHAIQQIKKSESNIRYPYDAERMLIEKVKLGDITGSNAILNSLLGNIILRNPGDINVLKARLIELLSVLSRAAAEAGLDIDLLLKKNLEYLNKVLNLDTQEDICAWVSNALRNFTRDVQSLKNSRTSTLIKPAIDYIEANYTQPVTVADVAKAVHLSPSRLAHVFKECLDTTVINYLTNVRISRAKELLLNTDESCTSITFKVGYGSQSYFTRTFKDLVGLTPRQFRARNRSEPGLRTTSSTPREC